MFKKKIPTLYNFCGNDINWDIVISHGIIGEQRLNILNWEIDRYTLGNTPDQSFSSTKYSTN